MKHILCLLFAILVTNAFAVDHFWDMRYNFGPESRPSPKIGVGVGIRSPFNSDVLFPINFTTRLNKEFDVGAKLDINTYGQLEEINTALDIGVRYRYKPSSFIAFDGYLDLSETSQSALAFTIGTQQFIAKCFANYYELRAGFLDGATGCSLKSPHRLAWVTSKTISWLTLSRRLNLPLAVRTSVSTSTWA